MINDTFSTLLADNQDYMKQFNRDSYADAFKDFCNKYLSLFTEINDEYNNTDNKEALIDELTSSLINPIASEYSEIKKSKQSTYMIDKNTLLVIYLLPAIDEFRGDFSGALIESIIKKWNETFKQNIKLGTFAEINAGFRRKLCYVTTAVCQSLGKNENCDEIKLLKNYRDTFLISEPDGKELIDTYYDIAPTIVNRINKCSDSEKIYEQIYKNYISPCIGYIEADRLSDCKELYVNMMHNLKTKYMS